MRRGEIGEVSGGSGHGDHFAEREKNHARHQREAGVGKAVQSESESAEQITHGHDAPRGKSPRVNRQREFAKHDERAVH